MKKTTITDVKKLMLDVNRLRNFANGGYNKAIESPKELHHERQSIDKYGRGFNTNFYNYLAAQEHKVTYSSWKGYFGDSSCSTILKIGCNELFWECFDKYLNEHQDEVLNGIADMMEKELQSSIDVIVQERDLLNKMIEEVQKGGQDVTE